MPHRAYDIRALAKAINRRRVEYNRAHPDHPVFITPAMSRLLESDPDYVPYRPRARRKRRPPIANPTIATVINIARALDVTVGELLGEPRLHLTPDERRRIRECLRYLSDVLELDRDR